jgi:hypothetical protein
MIQRDLHQKLETDIMAVRERLTKVVRPLDAGKMSQRPEPGAWSIGEVLEHLCVSDELYEPKMRKLIAGARRDAAAPARGWKSSFLGGLIAGGLEKQVKIKALKVFLPSESPRSGVLDAFLAMQLSVISMMDEAASVDWNKVRIGSVAMPWFAPKMNIGDAFRIHAVHSARHAGQIERVAARL